MQKKRKIIISIAISLGLALAATQISSNGGLQSAVLSASLQSCQNSSITSSERCKTPLTTEKTRIQKEIDALNKKIASKKTECIVLMRTPNRGTQLTTCRAQLRVLERDKTTQDANMRPIDVAISKLVSEAPLQTNILNAQKELDTIKAQATAKVSECNTLRAQNKTAQAATCNQQLIIIRQTQTTKQTAHINAINAFKKVAGASVPTPTSPTPVIQKVPTTPVPVIPVVPVIIAPVTPTVLHCCADSKAKNFNPTCGIAANTNPNSALCVYPINPGCTDTAATNYNAAADGDDGSCKAKPTLCMNGSSPNFMQPGPCQEPQEQQGCTDPRANNRNSSATVDDGSCTYDVEPACNGEGEHGYNPATRTCETCSDQIQNGDESDVDCGGKCGECRVGCKDPSAENYNPDPKVKEDNSTCSYQETNFIATYVCDDPDALNFDPNALGEPANHACQYNPVCDDDTALNFVPPKERKKGDKGNREVCTYCDPAKIARFNNEIKRGEGAKVKTEIASMVEKERECLKKEICKNTNIEVSTCSIATDYRLQYSNLQLYLEFSGSSPGTLDGTYRTSKEITISPTVSSKTRDALVGYMGNTSTLSKVKNECPFVRDLIKKELIKDYKSENTNRIKVTQMALYMLGKYSGQIDGDRQKTFDALKKHYVWSDKKFGAAYITDATWNVARATRFGYRDSGDNGIGTPFMDPKGDGINTNNTTIRGASLPLPVTLQVLCPNIAREVQNYIIKGLITGESKNKIDICKSMINSPNPYNPTSFGKYSGLGVLVTCIDYVNKAGLTKCQDIHRSAQVAVSSLDKVIIVPLVDIGPSEAVWNAQKEATIDLTYGSMKALSPDSTVPGTLYETCFDILPPTTNSTSKNNT